MLYLPVVKWWRGTDFIFRVTGVLRETNFWHFFNAGGVLLWLHGLQTITIIRINARMEWLQAVRSHSMVGLLNLNHCRQEVLVMYHFLRFSILGVCFPWSWCMAFGHQKPQLSVPSKVAIHKMPRIESCRKGNLGSLLPGESICILK